MPDFFAYQDWSVEVWLSIGSAFVAFISLIVNWRLVRRQEKREIEALIMQRDADLIAWADDAIDILANCQGLLRERARLLDERAFLELRSELRTALSVVLDRGRLFFPASPLPGDNNSASSEAAYTGEAAPPIAALDEAFRLLKDLDLSNHAYNRDDVLELVAVRREFVSTVFNAIDPRRRESVFSEYKR